MNTVNFIGIFVGVVGIVIAVMSYSASIKKRLPRYAIRGTNLVEGSVTKIKSLEMLYGGQKIEDLTATRIAFWNAGRETIHGNDIAEADPLHIVMKDNAKILSCEIVQQKNPANQFSISVSHDRVLALICFDYIDRDEGAVIQLLHTGTSSSAMQIQGQIKGAGHIKAASQPSRFAKAVSSLIFPAFIVALLLLPKDFNRTLILQLPIPEWAQTLMSTLSIVFLGMVAGLLSIILGNYLKGKSGPPKGFEAFFTGIVS